MNDVSAPGGYRRPVTAFWWLRRGSYVLFMLRELSGVSVAWFVFSLLSLLAAVGSGDQQYREFLQISAQPPMVALNVTALLLVLLHAITWFAQAPSAMALHVRGRRVPRRLIITVLYVDWVVMSALAVWVTLG